MERKIYKLLLISPAQPYIGYTAHAQLARMFGKKRLMIPLALPVVAAYTPDHYDILIVDEETEDVPVDYHPDIVGITTLNATRERAFQLGDFFKAKGIPVVMGGINASVLPEEYLEHSDAVVIGEAENAWERCLEDFERGELRKSYTADPKYDYMNPKKPRWDLVNMDLIFQVAVQVTRGCPFNCDFCLVSKIFGRKMRFRETDNVVEEIKSLPSKYIFFVDDNLTINKKYAHELMEKIKPLGISWACMASIDVADDEMLLEEMADAGCFNILIGFESLNPGSLDETHKTHNEGGRNFTDAIRKIHQAGIQINASFIVGFDNDTLEEFDRIYEFTLKTGMSNVNLHLLASPPGTVLYSKLRDQGRLFNVPLNMGAGFFPTIHYARMGQLEMFDKYMDTIKRLYSWETILEKAKLLFSNGAFTSHGVDISFLSKFRLTSILLKEFLLTKDINKRALFFFLIMLIRNKRIAVDRAFSFMLSMLSSHRQIALNLKLNDHYRTLIRQNDLGPWNDRDPLNFTDI
ncbi:MAG: radical SAM protein [Bacteroidia bacterium]|nr:radical SAM protein [Bacteroidia bacterium]